MKRERSSGSSGEMTDNAMSESRSMEGLFALQAKLADVTDLDRALDQILAFAVRCVETDWGTVQLISDDGTRLETVAQCGYAPDSALLVQYRQQAFAAVLHALRTTRAAHLVEDLALNADVADTLEREAALAEGIRAAVHAPMFTSSGRIVGVLNAHFREPHRPSQQQLRYFELLAWVAAAFVDRHETSTALKLRETEYRTTLASLTDAVIATDANAYVRYINPAAERLTGWSLEEAVGKSIEAVYDLTTMEGEPVVQCQLRRALSRRETIPKRRFLLCHRNDRRIPIEDGASPILDGDRLLGAVTVFVDISDRLSLEQRQTQAHVALEEQMHAATRELGQTHAQLRLLSQYLMSAQEDERRRLARELHDDLAQRAAVVEFDVEALRNSLHEPQDTDDLLERLRSNVRELARGLRETSHRLHPSVLEDLGLDAALRLLVEEHCRRGEDVTYLRRSEVPSMGSEVNGALYRIAQEALHNASRHAPTAPVRVMLAAEERELRLIIEDAGPGFSVTEVRGRGGLGLLSMHERANSVRGALAINAVPDEGTRVTVCVPIGSKSLDGAVNARLSAKDEIERMRDLSATMLARRERLNATVEQVQRSFADIFSQMQRRRKAAGPAEGSRDT
jgi:PAS domain S-box-containing protein